MHQFPHNTAAAGKVMSSTTHPAYANQSPCIIISMWDLAKIFEYAACRFTFIHLALDKSEHLVLEADQHSPSPAQVSRDIVKMLTEWQVGILDNDDLFCRFWTHNMNIPGDIMACYRMWKDWFDLIPFEMPNHISLEKVKKLCMAHMDQMRYKGGMDPLLTNLWVIKDDLQQLGMQLDSWLSVKVDEGRGALEVMAQMEGLVDDLHNAMAASQRLLDARGREDEE
ncbi:hypothetical protein DFJ58DRAFT_836037 [Suillus subalutaceus]|uniref:uncharacterized protein n=1 Tax=Suillus subalutaceus TaxID=48586 RepID=UPI001B85E37F|nr:uncharacterized protein DFJ58DRAFT_836037 [Suillus subalutaceus]KAG1875399.1 hypothetical protein DFJ58DRAFT_836037 [Suillus subalutaceus]